MPVRQTQSGEWTFRELVAEGLALLPAATPEWTDFNVSDPGITLLELFAYFSELLIFQTGQRPPEYIAAFTKLLRSESSDSVADPDQAMQEALLQIRQPQRAVTCADYEALSLRADTRVARCRCVPHQNLAERNEAARNANRPGHVSVVLVPTPGLDAESSAQTVTTVAAFLEPRRILTTRVHVVPVRRVDLTIRLRIVASPGVAGDVAIAAATDAVQALLDPLQAGPEGSGWPIGRHVYVSQLYLAVSRLDTTDHVLRAVDPATGARLEEIAVPEGQIDRLYRSAAGDLIGLRMAADEIPGSVSVALTAMTSALERSREV